MHEMKLDGRTLLAEARGDGDPVVLIHGTIFADEFGPLLSHEALSGQFRFVCYRRRGYHGSSRPDRPLTIGEHADDARSLMERLDIARAHVLGHSFGGAIALQLALDAPELVHSLVLLEPALAAGASGSGYLSTLAATVERCRAGEVEEALDEFLEPRFGADYREVLERSIPGIMKSAAAQAEDAFSFDLPALADWRFGAEEARQIRQPALAVLGEKSEALWDRFGETYRLLLEWLPQAEGFVLPGASHALQMENPGDMAEALAGFLRRHPIAGEGREQDR